MLNHLFTVYDIFYEYIRMLFFNSDVPEGYTVAPAALRHDNEEPLNYEAAHKSVTSW